MIGWLVGLKIKLDVAEMTAVIYVILPGI